MFKLCIICGNGRSRSKKSVPSQRTVEIMTAYRELATVGGCRLKKHTLNISRVLGIFPLPDTSTSTTKAVETAAFTFELFNRKRVLPYG